jgi:hypothetical protein
VTGCFTRVLGLVIAGIGVARLTTTQVRRIVQQLPIALGLLAVLIVGSDLKDVHARIALIPTTPFAVGYVGAGLYTAMVGSLIAIIGGVVVSKPAHNANGS